MGFNWVSVNFFASSVFLSVSGPKMSKEQFPNYTAAPTTALPYTHQHTLHLKAHTHTSIHADSNGEQEKGELK